MAALLSGHASQMQMKRVGKFEKPQLSPKPGFCIIV